MAARSAASAPKPETQCTPDRKRFALTHPSKAFDHRQNAARRDLADIDLAGRWFAPHYAVPYSRRCGASGADVHSTASADSQRISQLLPGENFAIVEYSGDWAWGFSEHDHYVGYVAAHLLIEPDEATHVVRSPAAPLLDKPSGHLSVIASLPMGARLTGQVEGDFLRTDGGFVAFHHLFPAGHKADDPVALAETMVGTPYLWGGRGLGGIDCSGLVQIAFGLVGIPLLRDSDQQALQGTEISGAARRGDLVFFPDHVVLLTGSDHAVHSSDHWASVTVEPLKDIIGRLGAPIAQRRILP